MILKIVFYVKLKQQKSRIFFDAIITQMIVKDDLQEFGTIPGIKKASVEGRHTKILAKCESIKNEVLKKAIKRNIETLINNVRDNNCELNLPQQQNKCRKAQIYPIGLKKNQLEHLQLYIKELVQTLDNEFDLMKYREKIKREDDQKGFHSQKKRTKTKQDGGKTNIRYLFEEDPDDILVQQVQISDVRDITLHIHSHSEDLEGMPDFKLYIYVVNKVADLSVDNMYVFSKGITNKRFIAFVPTHQNFEDECYDAIEKLKYQNIKTEMYNSKQVFCEYIYECIKDKEIKAYMPAQICSLITDMDYYSLNYTESCRRFDFCLIKVLELARKDRVYVQFDSLIEGIQRAIRISCKINITYQIDARNKLRMILQQQQALRIPEKLIQIQEHLGHHTSYIQSGKKKTFQQYMLDRIKQRLRQLIDPKYAKYLSDEELSENKQTRKKAKTREEQLGFTSKQVFVTPKMKLQNQITKMIKDVTEPIRQFALTIKWSDIRFDERIRPSIPLKIVKAMKEEPNVKQLVQLITSNYFKPISSLMSQFPDDQMGEGLYIIKTLELSGLITLSRKEINPIVYNNFFEKSKFND